MSSSVELLLLKVSIMEVVSSPIAMAWTTILTAILPFGISPHTAMRLYEQREEKEGKPQSHAFA